MAKPTSTPKPRFSVMLEENTKFRERLSDSFRASITTTSTINAVKEGKFHIPGVCFYLYLHAALFFPHVSWIVKLTNWFLFYCSKTVFCIG